MADTAMNLASPVQLDMIDKLRGHGISNFVAVPQLAVVGDQSSSKSSVLESISNLPFPRDSGLCTRFATQIIFRRDDTSSIKVSIIPGPDRSLKETNKLGGYTKGGPTASTRNGFLEILQEVCQLMGISGPGQSLEKSQSTFSDDLLSIELCGPDKQNLSTIDIPGIFRTPTEGVTTENDMNLRTIILAVIPSNTDIATQEILSIAKELDPKGLWTLGVLTKPDLVDKGGEENLRLGYCIVRNRGQSELSSHASERDRKEKDFFMTEPWSRLDENRLLVSLTRREFPKVQAQIVKMLSISNFQDITNCALDAYYSGHKVFGTVERMERFAKEIDTLGHTVSFDSEAEEVATDDSSLVDSTPSSNGSEAEACIPGLQQIPSQIPSPEQSKNWERLTLTYIADIIFFVHDFIYKALAHVCHDEGVRSSLWSVLQKNLFDGYGRAINHVRFIIQVEKFGTPLTTNHYYNENLQKCKTRRAAKLLGKYATSQDSHKPGKLDQIIQPTAMDNSEYVIQENHDILESYYKVAKKRFVDTICMQGSDFYLLTGPTSPLRIFGTEFVSKLSSSELDFIAGEDVSTTQLRGSLKKQIAALKEGEKLIRM
ncbi:dynamin GTPase [Amylocarpus encephaloides]|uniref:Dynamin GTPase n=1 Tax=Amylocarpus encephaloides TaxID=45428 RepID=A0A9P7YI47_9HELO|nr:dynamin GTPase [Amylocarpus encephaloides]